MQSFDITATCSHARAGTLSGKMLTPAPLLYTRRGFPAALTLRELEALSNPSTALCLGLQISVADFIEDAGSVLAKVPGGLREFCGFKGRDDFLVLSGRDALTPQTSMPASDGWVTLVTGSGQKKVTVEQYIAFVATTKVDAIAWLTDEVVGDGAERRHKKSIDRGLVWLDKGLAARDKGEIPASTLIFAGVGGGGSARERERAAAEISKRAVDGFVFTGMGSGESCEERDSMLTTSISLLQDHKPRIIVGLGTPAEVLQCVGHGVDLFETAYPYLVSSQGYAIAYPVRYEEVMGGGGRELRELDEGEGGKLNLRDTKYNRDTQPLVKGCECFACGRHTRAYIHHLLNTREMLAEVLLNSHNHHQYQLFFASIRQAIAKDKFSEFSTAFLCSRQRS